MDQTDFETAKEYFRGQIRLTGVFLGIVWWLFFFSTAAIVYSLWDGQTDWIFIASALSFFFATNLVCLQIHNHQLSTAFQGLVLPSLLANADTNHMAHENS